MTRFSNVQHQCRCICHCLWHAATTPMRVTTLTSTKRRTNCVSPTQTTTHQARRLQQKGICASECGQVAAPGPGEVYDGGGGTCTTPLARSERPSEGCTERDLGLGGTGGGDALPLDIWKYPALHPSQRREVARKKLWCTRAAKQMARSGAACGVQSWRGQKTGVCCERKSGSVHSLRRCQSCGARGAAG